MIKNYLKLIRELDGNVEVIDVKLNNRKTKKIGEKKNEKKKIKIGLKDWSELTKRN